MGFLMENNSEETLDLLERARAADATALTEIFSRRRQRLRRMVEMRLSTGACKRGSTPPTSSRTLTWKLRRGSKNTFASRNCRCSSE
jgi:hypothetical protein